MLQAISNEEHRRKILFMLLNLMLEINVSTETAGLPEKKHCLIGNNA
jgi:hypothetical protein